MERIDDTIKMDDRDEILQLIRALETIPENEKNEAVKNLLNHLEWMDMMW